MNDKTGSIVNDDGKENAAAMRNNGKINFATFWKMELQFYGKMICNFLEKCLAKNTNMNSSFKKANVALCLQRVHPHRTLTFCGKIFLTHKCPLLILRPKKQVLINNIRDGLLIPRLRDEC